MSASATQGGHNKAGKDLSYASVTTVLY